MANIFMKYSFHNIYIPQRVFISKKVLSLLQNNTKTKIKYKAILHTKTNHPDLFLLPQKSSRRYHQSSFYSFPQQLKNLLESSMYLSITLTGSSNEDDNRGHIPCFILSSAFSMETYMQPIKTQFATSLYRFLDWQ